MKDFLPEGILCFKMVRNQVLSPSQQVERLVLSILPLRFCYLCAKFLSIMRQNILGGLLVLLMTTGCGESTEQTDTAQSQNQPAAPVASKLNEEGTGKMVDLVAKYYALKDALVATNATKANEAAAELNKQTDTLMSFLKNDSLQPQNLTILLDTLKQNSQWLADAKDETTEKQRVHFEKISDAMYALLQQAELKNAGVYRQYCPMAFNDKGAYWLSNETEIRNPYFGKKMLECGEVTDSLK